MLLRMEGDKEVGKKRPDVRVGYISKITCPYAVLHGATRQVRGPGSRDLG